MREDQDEDGFYSPHKVKKIKVDTNATQHLQSTSAIKEGENIS